ncbi:MAG: hypothetical protein PUK70_00110 [Bacteroidales bacterium]|nr:hypothetical protein [Bacteroidales bacterium]MDY6002575.1 hypothetical protein [Candidatus Cryptobacteroides sp.]
MNSITRIFILMFSLVAAGMNSSCEKNEDQNIYSFVTLKGVLPDGRQIVRMEANYDLASTFMRNLNNRLEYQLPIFTNNEASMVVQKGVYLVSFDATATFPDGSSARVRSAEHVAPKNALFLMNDKDTVTLNLKYLNY